MAAIGAVPLHVTSPPECPRWNHMSQYLQFRCAHDSVPKPDSKVVAAYHEWEQAKLRFEQYEARVRERRRHYDGATATAMSVLSSVLDADELAASSNDDNSFFDLPYGESKEQAQRDLDLLLLDRYSDGELERMRRQVALLEEATWWGKDHLGNGRTRSRCRVCWAMVDALPRERMSGVGFLECHACPNQWCEPRHNDADPYTFATLSLCPTCGREAYPSYLGPPRKELCDRWRQGYRDYHYRVSLYQVHLSQLRRQREDRAAGISLLPAQPKRDGRHHHRQYKPQHRYPPRLGGMTAAATAAVASV